MGDHGPRRKSKKLQEGFSNRDGDEDFPVDQCRGRTTMRTAVRVHFLHRHIRDTVIILEEGNLPHPQCPKCNMLVPCKALNGRHVTTAQCTKEVEWKIWQLAE